MGFIFSQAEGDFGHSRKANPSTRRKPGDPLLLFGRTKRLGVWVLGLRPRLGFAKPVIAIRSAR